MSAAPGEVAIRGLTFTYPAQAGLPAPAPALIDVSLTVEPGAILGVLGTSGAGKSTLCLALNGIVPRRTGGVFRGEVTIGGWSTREHEVAALATRVAMVFQQPDSNFVGLSVVDEVAFGPEQLGVPAAEIERRVDWALARVEMSAYRDRLPAQLSGGQKQRVAIAAALAMQPAVLVLDEPTAALDPVGVDEVTSVLAALAAGRETTIILVSQDVDSLVETADMLLVLDAGRVIATGTATDVFAPAALPELVARGIPVPTATRVRAALNERLGTAFTFTTDADATRELAVALPSA